jgi:hypothetical protein
VVWVGIATVGRLVGCSAWIGKGKLAGTNSGMRLGFGPESNRKRTPHFSIFYKCQTNLNSNQI